MHLVEHTFRKWATVEPMARRKAGGVHPAVWGFLGLVVFAVAVDLAKDETESFLKRNGLWPRS